MGNMISNMLYLFSVLLSSVLCLPATASSSVIMMTRGFTSHSLTEVEILGDDSCSVTDLPDRRQLSVTVVTPDNLVLNCGGDPNSRSCLYLDTQTNSWRYHSSLTRDRYGAVAVS